MLLFYTKKSYISVYVTTITMLTKYMQYSYMYMYISLRPHSFYDAEGQYNSTCTYSIIHVTRVCRCDGYGPGAVGDTERAGDD